MSSPGHRVETATSGHEALARLQAFQYDVILTDVRMPDMDGLEVFAEIERAGRSDRGAWCSSRGIRRLPG